MMLKSKIFTFLAALSLICLVFSSASPLPRDVGDTAEVTLTKLDGKVTFTQKTDTIVEGAGKLNKGIEENEPDDYFVQLGNQKKVSFKKLGITIVPPGTKPWTNEAPGVVSQLDGVPLAFFHKDEQIDVGTIKCVSCH